MLSMTGYGKGTARAEGVELTIEVKSVNNRFLDVAIKSPRTLFEQEEGVRAAVRGSIARGHVDVYVGIVDRREQVKAMRVDLGAARGYVAAAEQLAATFPALRDDLTLSYFLRLPDVVRAEEGEAAFPVALLFEALERALCAHTAMRRAEGERLKQDLLARMQTIASLIARIQQRAPRVAEEYRAKLTARMQELLAGNIEESRILSEAAVFADKCNIDEELTRLGAHVKAFFEICEEEQVGRKLDFLVQEFNRECNTICSKSNDQTVTALALAMKNEIEKVREQIQNLE